MNILFADQNHAVLHETLRAAGFECHLAWDKKTDELIKLLPAYDALVIRSRFKLTKEILENCSRLKCIGRVGAGMENIDVAFAGSRGIVCVCAPEGNRHAVGEHALGMLLMLMNNLKKADAEVRKGTWLRAENRGHELNGKTVGIIGYGHMGSSFAKKLQGFDCRILAYDKYKKDYGNSSVKECQMQELFDECDVLSLHVPLTDDTKYLVNKTYLSNFKKQLYFLNTARGPCVNTAELVEAIIAGKIKGACLDVLEYESTSFESIPIESLPAPMQFLIQSNKVILSPHIAGWTYESDFKMSKLVAERMMEVLLKR